MALGLFVVTVTIIVDVRASTVSIPGRGVIVVVNDIFL